MSENLSAMEVIQKVTWYVSEQCKQSKSASTCTFQKHIFLDITMLYRFGLSLLTLLIISYKNINKTDRPFRKGNVCIKIFVNLNRSDTKHIIYT